MSQCDKQTTCAIILPPTNLETVMTSKRDKLRQDIRDAKQTTSKTKVGGKFAEPQHSAYIIPAKPEYGRL